MTSFIAALHLGVRYLRHHRAQTLLLASCLGLVFAIPAVLRISLRAAEHELLHRATSTPLVLGTRGSALDLVLSSLYFRRPAPNPITLGDVQAATSTGLASVIPLHIRFHSQETPIIGTELEYFSARQLKLASGQWFARLGDCVIGANFAARRQLKPGQSVISSPEQAFDLAGSYPLKMRITGQLAPNGTADDDAIFVDLKTAWLIEGRAHGHDDLTTLPLDQLINPNRDTLVASPAVRLFNEVTPQNIRSFHFHGHFPDYPVTSALIFPHDAKADALLTGRYQNPRSPLQLVAPPQQIRSLLASLLQIEHLLILLFITTSSCALGITALVFALSFRLRAREFQTLRDIGLTHYQITLVRLVEINLTLLLALALATLAATISQLLAPHLIRILLTHS
jgi:putative ABC transport system permease protein